MRSIQKGVLLVTVALAIVATVIADENVCTGYGKRFGKLGFNAKSDIKFATEYVINSKVNESEAQVGENRYGQIRQIRYFFEGISQIQVLYTDLGEAEEKGALIHGFEKNKSMTNAIELRALSEYHFNTTDIAGKISALGVYTGEDVNDTNIYGIHITEYY